MNDEFSPPPASRLPFSPWYIALAGAAGGLAVRAMERYGTLPAEGKYYFYLFLLPLLISAVTVRFARGDEHSGWGGHMASGALANSLFVCGTFIALPERMGWAFVVVPLAALYGGAGAALIAILTGKSTTGSRLPLSGWYPMLAGALCGIGLRLVYSGDPGKLYSPMNLSFIAFAPLAVGAVTVYVAERTARRSWNYYLMAGILANALFILGTMLILLEGMICAILIFPLFAMYGALGALVMGALCRATNWPRHSVYGFALLPLLLGSLAPNGAGEAYIGNEERTVLIQAAPAAVWQQLNDTRNIQPSEVDGAWMYRIGVPLPESGVTHATSNGHERTVTMGKAIHFTQVAAEWEENRRVRWTYRFDTDSFPPHALDDHIRIGGHYFDLVDTVYTLTPKGNGATELKVSMRYRVSTQYNWYTRRIAQFLIGNLENVFLDFYARRAEKSA